MIQREHDGVRWVLQPDFAPLLDELLKSPGETVKESPVKRVTRHELGAKAFFVKRCFHHAVPLRTRGRAEQSAPARMPPEKSFDSDGAS